MCDVMDLPKVLLDYYQDKDMASMRTGGRGGGNLTSVTNGGPGSHPIADGRDDMKVIPSSPKSDTEDL